MKQTPATPTPAQRNGTSRGPGNPYIHGVLKKESRTLDSLLDGIPREASSRISSMAFDALSSTAMLVDGITGQSLAPPKWYNEIQSKEAVGFAEVFPVLVRVRHPLPVHCAFRSHGSGFHVNTLQNHSMAYRRNMAEAQGSG